MKKNILDIEPTNVKLIVNEIKKDDVILPKYNIRRVIDLSGGFKQAKFFVTTKENSTKDQMLQICKKITSDHSNYLNIVICIYSDTEMGIAIAKDGGESLDSNEESNTWLAMYTYNDVEGVYFDDRPTSFLEEIKMHMHYFLKCFLILFASSFCQTQSQIESAKKYIKNSGLTDQQVIDAAKKRGYTDKQIAKVIQDEKPDGNKTNIESKLKKEIDEKYVEPFVEDVDPDLDEIENDKDEKPNEKKESINNLTQINDEMNELEYFGYDIFKQDPKLFQASSVGAIDPEYLIGPGDEIIVMLWGETQFRQVLKVNREGFIFIPDIGQVFVNGLNLKLLESKLFRVLSQSFSSLDPYGRKATTFLDVSIGNLRPLKIQVVGEVAQPGIYTVSPSTTLFSSLYYFNGPTKLGSLRDIRLIRGGKEIRSIDFYNYLLSGKKPQDENLQLDDVIFIPKRKNRFRSKEKLIGPGSMNLNQKKHFLIFFRWQAD